MLELFSIFGAVGSAAKLAVDLGSASPSSSKPQPDINEGMPVDTPPNTPEEVQPLADNNEEEVKKKPAPATVTPKKNPEANQNRTEKKDPILELLDQLNETMKGFNHMLYGRIDAYIDAKKQSIKDAISNVTSSILDKVSEWRHGKAKDNQPAAKAEAAATPDAPKATDAKPVTAEPIDPNAARKKEL
ncbi:MAG: hypothetical protein PSV35_00715, partial [bacterium]|nr:hypothetical protein [bacterium]